MKNKQSRVIQLTIPNLKILYEHTTDLKRLPEHIDWDGYLNYVSRVGIPFNTPGGVVTARIGDWIAWTVDGISVHDTPPDV